MTITNAKMTSLLLYFVYAATIYVWVEDNTIHPIKNVQNVFPVSSTYYI